MSIFAGVGSAKVFENGVYLQPDSRYELEIEKLLVKKTRKSKTLFIAELRVTASSNDKDKVGDKRSFVQDMGADAALGTIKAFVHTVLGYETSRDKTYLETNVDPKLEGILDEATGDANPLKGRKVGCQTVGIITKEKKQPFTRHDWFPTDKAVPMHSAG